MPRPRWALAEKKQSEGRGDAVNLGVSQIGIDVAPLSQVDDAARADFFRSSAEDLYRQELAGSAGAPELVAFSGGEFAGALWGSAYYHPHLEKDVVEIDVVVAEAARGKGVARRLVERFSMMNDHATLVANPITEDGEGLLKALGFRRSRRADGLWVISKGSPARR